MISGHLLLDKTDPTKKLIHRILKLLIPLIIWYIFYSFYHFSSRYYQGLNSISPLASLSKIFFGETDKTAHLWYLYMLLGIYISLPLLRRFCQSITRNEFRLLLIIYLINDIFVMLSPQLNAKFDIALTWQYGFDFIGIYFGYLIIGYSIGKLDFINYKSWFKLSSILLILIIANFLPALLWKLKLIDIESVSYINPFLVLLSTHVFIFLKKSNQLINKFPPLINQIISNLASYTFSVYLIHLACLDIIMNLFELGEILRGKLIYRIPMIAFITYILSIILVILLKKISYKIKVLSWIFP
jgi:surface polysaccharide O-acyltransferase-like enzyme